MVLVRGGEFLMGSDTHYPEERPVRRVSVGDYWIDEHPVTNAEFANFVAETGYVTLAEIPPNPREYPGMPIHMAQAGSAVFVQPDGPVNMGDPGQWWRFVFGASWRQPLGPDSSIEGLEDHPVVQIAWKDAVAYAVWAGKALPTEAEWEYAARGGHQGQTYAWGEEFTPGRIMANYWHGRFPWENTADDGFYRTSPVGSFPPNDFGLHDMIGNVWEWTADRYRTVAIGPARSCCAPRSETPAHEMDRLDPWMPEESFPPKVLKGGSHLCAANYCQRYRPAARYAQPVDSPTSHIGFRCIVRRGAS